MKLSEEQIRIVEIYLENKNFDFIDLKYEILDHMISDIEHLMLNNISFDSACRRTILKWDRHFNERSSFYFGLLFSESRLVIKKAVKLFKPFYFGYLFFYFLPIVILNFIELKISKDLVTLFDKLILNLSLIALCYIVFITFKLIKSKRKTTYSFIIKTQYSGLLLLIIGSFFGIVGNDQIIKAVFLGFVLAGFFVVYIFHHFYVEHKKEIRKFEKV